MQINREELEKALTLVKPGLAARDIVEQSTSFAFIDGCVVTYNDDISLSCPVAGLEIQGAIKADEFFQFIRKVKKDEIDVEVEGEEIVFKAGRTKAGFTLQEKILMPLENLKEKKTKWYPIPDDFCHYLSLAMGACGSDMSRELLTGVNVEKDGHMTGSDSFKIMRCDTGQSLPVDTFLIPAKSAVEVVKLDPEKIARGKGWIHFKDKTGATLSCKLFEEEYPDVSEYMDVIGYDISFPQKIHEILDRAGVFAKREHILDEEVVISVEDNRFKVSAKSDTGWIHEEVNFKFEEDPFMFTVTPYLLRDILKETSNCIVGERALKFQGAGWEYIAWLQT